MVKQDIFSIGRSTESTLRVDSGVQELSALLQNRVKHLFDVEVSVLPSACSDGSELNDDTSSVLLKLTGGENQDAIDRAKEYITGVCCPECRVDVRGYLLEEDKAIGAVDLIEKDTSAYLAVNGEGFLELCGSKMAVALATSTLEQLRLQHKRPMTNLDTLNDCTEVPSETSQVSESNTPSKIEDIADDEIIWKKRELPPPRKSERKVKECIPAAKKAEVGISEPCIKDDKTADTEAAKVKIEERTNDINNVSVSCSEKQQLDENSNSQVEPVMASECELANVPVKESLRDFAIKLRYSEAEVTSVLAKLGPEADKNSVLHELVKTQNSQKELEDGSSVFERESKVIATQMALVDPNCLRPIVLDGSNVAMSHGNQQVFSCRGIGIAVDWFLQRGHRDIKVFVPSWRKEASRPKSPIIDQEVLTRLEQDHVLVWTPSRMVNGRRVVCYDDRFIVKLASTTEGVIVSNDNFRDLQNESSEWKKVIEQRLLMYSFVNDRFMPPDDPHGRHGPKLEEFLRKGCGKNCPYGRRCTYGNRCKFLHPERNSKSEAELQSMAVQLSEPALRVPEVPYGEVLTYRETCGASRPGRPLPPPPDMPAYLLTKPLPPTPVERPKNKPLPFPPQDAYHHNMVQMFPPTLRNNQSITSQSARPASDPTPVRDPYMDMNALADHFNRNVSLPSLENCGMGMSRRGSVPQLAYPDGYPSLPPASGHAVFPPPPHPNMACPPDLVARGMVTPDGRPQSGEWRQDPVYGACGLHPAYAAHYAPNQQPGYPSQPWGMTPPYSQPPPTFNPHSNLYHYTSNQQHYHPGPGFQRVPYRGQGNGYYRTRGVPLNGDVVDGPEGCSGADAVDKHGSACSEELRIKAYEQLSEVFPGDVEKILKILEENPKESNVEKLTQMLLDEQEVPKDE